jgi:hypothetical protein
MPVIVRCQLQALIFLFISGVVRFSGLLSITYKEQTDSSAVKAATEILVVAMIGFLLLFGAASLYAKQTGVPVESLFNACMCMSSSPGEGDCFDDDEDDKIILRADYDLYLRMNSVLTTLSSSSVSAR